MRNKKQQQLRLGRKRWQTRLMCKPYSWPSWNIQQIYPIIWPVFWEFRSSGSCPLKGHPKFDVANALLPLTSWMHPNPTVWRSSIPQNIGYLSTELRSPSSVSHVAFLHAKQENMDVQRSKRWKDHRPQRDPHEVDLNFREGLVDFLPGFGIDLLKWVTQHVTCVLNLHLLRCNEHSSVSII